MFSVSKVYPPARSASTLVSLSAASLRVLPYRARRFGPSAVCAVYFASQRPSLRREIEPSPLPRLPIVISFHQLFRLVAPRLGQFLLDLLVFLAVDDFPLWAVRGVDAVAGHEAPVFTLGDSVAFN